MASSSLTIQNVAAAAQQAVRRARQNLDNRNVPGTSMNVSDTDSDRQVQPDIQPDGSIPNFQLGDPLDGDDSSDFQPDADTMVSEVRRKFRRKRVGGDPQAPAAKLGRKRANQWKTKLFLMQSSVPTKTPTAAEQERLEINGLGSPAHERPTLNVGRRKSVLQRSWSIQQLDTFVQRSYPTLPLGSDGFEYGFAKKSRSLTKIERRTVHKVSDIEDFVGQGKFYIIPNQDIVSTGSRTVQPAMGSQSWHTQRVQADSVQPDVADPQVSGGVTPPPAQPLPDAAEPQVVVVNDVSSDSDSELPQYVLSGTPNVEFRGTVDFNEELKRDVKEAFDALDNCISEDIQEIVIRRDAVLEDVIAAYRSRDLASSRLKVKFAGEEGSDHGGLTRDMLSMFWTEAGQLYFAGEAALVPWVPLHRQRTLKPDYTALGTILSHTASLTGIIPPRLSRTFLTMLVFGDAPSEDYLLSDLLEYITTSERSLLKRALRNYEGLTSAEQGKLTDIFSMYAMYEAPSANLIKQQLVSIAEAELVMKPRPYIDAMRKGIPAQQLDMFWRQLSLQMIDFIYSSQSPSGKKVANVIEATNEDLRPQEELVLWWMRDFVTSLDTEDVADFLRFTTGSSVMPRDPIQLEFLAHARYPTARTCSNLIQCPLHYTSRNQLKREWRAILGSPLSFEMSLM